MEVLNKCYYQEFVCFLFCFCFFGFFLFFCFVLFFCLAFWVFYIHIEVVFIFSIIATMEIVYNRWRERKFEEIM